MNISFRIIVIGFFSAILFLTQPYAKSSLPKADRDQWTDLLKYSQQRHMPEHLKFETILKITTLYARAMAKLTENFSATTQKDSAIQIPMVHQELAVENLKTISQKYNERPNTNIDLFINSLDETCKNLRKNNQTDWSDEWQKNIDVLDKLKLSEFIKTLRQFTDEKDKKHPLINNLVDKQHALYNSLSKEKSTNKVNIHRFNSALTDWVAAAKDLIATLLKEIDEYNKKETSKETNYYQQWTASKPAVTPKPQPTGPAVLTGPVTPTIPLVPPQPIVIPAQPTDPLVTPPTAPAPQPSNPQDAFESLCSRTPTNEQTKLQRARELAILYLITISLLKSRIYELNLLNDSTLMPTLESILRDMNKSLPKEADSPLAQSAKQYIVNAFDRVIKNRDKSLNNHQIFLEELKKMDADILNKLTTALQKIKTNPTAEPFVTFEKVNTQWNLIKEQIQKDLQPISVCLTTLQATMKQLSDIADKNILKDKLEITQTTLFTKTLTPEELKKAKKSFDDLISIWWTKNKPEEARGERHLQLTRLFSLVYFEYKLLGAQLNIAFPTLCGRRIEEDVQNLIKTNLASDEAWAAIYVIHTCQEIFDKIRLADYTDYDSKRKQVLNVLTNLDKTLIKKIAEPLQTLARSLKNQNLADKTEEWYASLERIIKTS